MANGFKSRCAPSNNNNGSDSKPEVCVKRTILFLLQSKEVVPLLHCNKTHENRQIDLVLRLPLLRKKTRRDKNLETICLNSIMFPRFSIVFQ